jgi:hypothetical protein
VNTPSPLRPECGTYAGYKLHGRRGEPYCDPCRDANTAYHRDRRKDPDVVREIRRYNAARGRALWRLSREYPARFAELAADELQKGGEA